MRHQYLNTNWLAFVTLLLLLSGLACERPVHVKLVEAETPTFQCDVPSALSGLTILRVPNEYIEKNSIPGEVLGIEAIVWAIHGDRTNPRIPVTYGKVPEGMVEDHPAKSLEEGGFYLIVCSQNDYGGCTGPTFIIKDGKAVRK